MHDIDKNLTEIVRNNEELENTISKIIENDTEDNDHIVNILKDMMVEGKERVEKLLNTHRAASAPTSRAALAPIKIEEQVRQWISEEQVRQWNTEGRQGNIVVTDNGKINKKHKDKHNIDETIEEIIRDTNELENTIMKITINKDNIDDKDNIIDMLNDMMVESKERSRSSWTCVGLLRRP